MSDELVFQFKSGSEVDLGFSHYRTPSSRYRYDRTIANEQNQSRGRNDVS